MSEETWRPVVGYAGYEVSDHGRVRSVDRRIVQPCGWGHWISRRLAGMVLRLQPHTSGYMQVQLGKSAALLVHRLVLTAFVGPQPEGYEGAHDDGVRSNNVLSNLRWATPMDNANDRRRHGTSGRGMDNPHARLTDEQVRAMRDRAPYVTLTALAREFGISAAHASKIVARVRWPHV